MDGDRDNDVISIAYNKCLLRWPIDVDCKWGV